VEGREKLSVRIGELQRRAQACKVSVWLAVFGLVQLRERGWVTDLLGEEVLSDQQAPEGGAEWMSWI
jgi:hypothetical protein